MKEREIKKGKRWGSKWTRGKEGCPGPTRGAGTHPLHYLSHCCYWPARLTAAKLSQCQHHNFMCRRLLRKHTNTAQPLP